MDRLATLTPSTLTEIEALVTPRALAIMPWLKGMNLPNLPQWRAEEILEDLQSAH